MLFDCKIATHTFSLSLSLYFFISQCYLIFIRVCYCSLSRFLFWPGYYLGGLGLEKKKLRLNNNNCMITKFSRKRLHNSALHSLYLCVYVYLVKRFIFIIYIFFEINTTLQQKKKHIRINEIKREREK